MRLATGTCRECEAAFEYSPDADLKTLECPKCDERACASCGLCSELISPEDFADHGGHWQCQEAEQEREANDRRRIAADW